MLFDDIAVPWFVLLQSGVLDLVGCDGALGLGGDALLKGFELPKVHLLVVFEVQYTIIVVFLLHRTS